MYGKRLLLLLRYSRFSLFLINSFVKETAGAYVNSSESINFSFSCSIRSGNSRLFNEEKEGLCGHCTDARISFDICCMCTAVNNMTRQHLHFFLNRHLGNFPDTLAFGKFPRYPGNWEIPQVPIGIWGWFILRFWKFLKWLDIWGISRKHSHLENFPDTLAFGKFLFLTFLIIAVTPSVYFKVSIRLNLWFYL